MNLSSIKEKLGGKDKRLIDYFIAQFGPVRSKTHKVARRNFCQSLAAYSLVCYILQIKDRHNENIMLDIEGHLFHIDFGFLLSNAPGKGIKFESAPFKLNIELVEVLGGDRSQEFREFRDLMRQGFMAL
jgi:phosphatidylinositol kinase/protein kinase (PI-3  family)